MQWGTVEGTVPLDSDDTTETQQLTAHNQMVFEVDDRFQGEFE